MTTECDNCGEIFEVDPDYICNFCPQCAGKIFLGEGDDEV